jgi:hypothetical protein
MGHLSSTHPFVDNGAFGYSFIMAIFIWCLSHPSIHLWDDINETIVTKSFGHLFILATMESWEP